MQIVNTECNLFGHENSNITVPPSLGTEMNLFTRGSFSMM